MANFENLKLTIDLLRRIRVEKRPFSIHFWQNFLPEAVEYRSIDGEVHSCDMICCVGSWMAHDPEHNSKGFIFKDRGVLYKEFVSFDALAAFWDVTLGEALNVTSPGAYLEANPKIEIPLARLQSLYKKYA